MQIELPSQRCRVAIFTTDDVEWSLTTWKRTIPVLLEAHDVIGIYLFPNRLGTQRGLAIPLWYLRVFGLKPLIVLGLFALKRRVGALRSPIRNWQQLARRHGVQLHRADSPNAEEVVRWSRQNRLDVILISVGHILQAPILATVRLAFINKHAALLPSCRGLLPYFWALLNELPTGITFHEVDAGIDTGRSLLQVRYPPGQSRMSMLRFYIDVFALFPALAKRAVERAAAGEHLTPRHDCADTYHSLPTRQDYKAFRRKGLRVCRFSDVFYAPRLHVTALEDS